MRKKSRRRRLLVQKRKSRRRKLPRMPMKKRIRRMTRRRTKRTRIIIKIVRYIELIFTFNYLECQSRKKSLMVSWAFMTFLFLFLFLLAYCFFSLFQNYLSAFSLTYSSLITSLTFGSLTVFSFLYSLLFSLLSSPSYFSSSSLSSSSVSYASGTSSSSTALLASLGSLEFGVLLEPDLSVSEIFLCLIVTLFIIFFLTPFCLFQVVLVDGFHGFEFFFVGEAASLDLLVQVLRLFDVARELRDALVVEAETLGKEVLDIDHITKEVIFGVWMGGGGHLREIDDGDVLVIID
jgi:hypothetical protein